MRDICLQHLGFGEQREPCSQAVELYTSVERAVPEGFKSNFAHCSTRRHIAKHTVSPSETLLKHQGHSLFSSPGER